MANMLTTIVPKSDQLNADDLIGRTMTIKVTKVSLLAGEQPVAIGYEGDNGKPYKPCKSMRRVLVGIWGPDGNAYIGRSMTLYRDEKVTFGAAAVGGIRISHLSHIDKPVTMALTATRASRKPYTVNPLLTPEDESELLKRAGKDAANAGTESLRAWWESLGAIKRKQIGADYLNQLKEIATLGDRQSPTSQPEAQETPSVEAGGQENVTAAQSEEAPVFYDVADSQGNVYLPSLSLAEAATEIIKRLKVLKPIDGRNGFISANKTIIDATLASDLLAAKELTKVL